MTHLERRQSPRTTLAGHAYVNIEPNNGGIVLNVSDAGLCFHSFDPVQRNGKVRFWFAGNNRRIEADATLAWTDETHKAGLRFIALPAEAREQIRNWMSQSITPLAVGKGAVPVSPQPPSIPTVSAPRPEAKAIPAASVPIAKASPEATALQPVSGFSRGLVTGLLVSAVVVAVFSFQNYRREFGESLIRLGERFAAKPQAQATATPAASAAPTAAAMILPAAPQTVLPAAAPIPAPPPKKTLPPADKRVEPREKFEAEPEIVSRTFVNPVKPQPQRPEPARPTTTAPAVAAATPAPKVSPTTSAPAVALMPPSPPPASSPTASASGSSLVPNKPAPAPTVEPVKQPEVQTESSAVQNAASTSELYFEVGRFKNQSQAHIEINKLAQLGFPALSVQKGFLWTNSYHILVGPYSDEDRAKTTHEHLVSSGFKPRPFERGSRAFTLASPVTLNGARTPAGDYIVSWESSLDEASVKLLHNDDTIATANAKWVKRDAKYPRDAYVYRRNADGSRTLLELRFGGTRQALVFGKSS